MDKQYFGYTLVEMLVVIAIMSFIAVLSLYGMKSQDKTHFLNSAQKDFLNTLRSTQNKVNTGANGLAVRTVRVPTDIILPTGVSITSPSADICFVNSNISTYTTIIKCGLCISGSGYICTGSTASSPTFFDVIFFNGVMSKTVRIEGTGMTIGRIYERN